MVKTYYLLLSTCCLATAVLFAAPIRSSLGAAGAEYVEEDAALPTDYITDGLVAYFDALENEDWGIYNPVPMVWKDLTGNGYDLPLDGTDVYFSDGVCTVPVGTTINSGHALEVEAERIEVVWRIIKKSPFVIEKLIHTGGTEWKGIIVRYRGYGLTHGENSNFLSTIGSDGELPLGTYSFFYYDNYANGIKQSSTAVSIKKLPDLNGVGITTSENIILKICCIRFYNRKLTPEEIWHNYTIDQLRFNVP